MEAEILQELQQIDLRIGLFAVFVIVELVLILICMTRK